MEREDMTSLLLRCPRLFPGGVSPVRSHERSASPLLEASREHHLGRVTRRACLSYAWEHFRVSQAPGSHLTLAAVLQGGGVRRGSHRRTLLQRLGEAKVASKVMGQDQDPNPVF